MFGWLLVVIVCSVVRLFIHRLDVGVMYLLVLVLAYLIVCADVMDGKFGDFGYVGCSMVEPIYG